MEGQTDRRPLVLRANLSSVSWGALLLREFPSKCACPISCPNSVTISYLLWPLLWASPRESLVLAVASGWECRHLSGCPHGPTAAGLMHPKESRPLATTQSPSCPFIPHCVSPVPVSSNRRCLRSVGNSCPSSVLTFYKVAINTKLANTPSSFLGENGVSVYEPLFTTFSPTHQRTTVS